MWSDAGIAIRLPEPLDDAGIGIDALTVDPEDAADVVVAELPGTALFASRFRDAAAPALIPPLPPRAGRAPPAVAAAPALGRPAGRGWPIPQLPDPAGSHPRVPQRRVRPARAARGAGRHPLPEGPGGGGGDAPRFAVRPVASVRLDRGLHVRGRRPAGRAPGGGAGAGPRPARRPPRRRRAARAARRRSAGRPGAGAPVAGGGSPRPRRRRGPRPAAAPGPAVAGRARRPERGRPGRGLGRRLRARGGGLL